MGKATPRSHLFKKLPELPLYTRSKDRCPGLRGRHPGAERRKYRILFLLIITQLATALAQPSIYDNFEGKKLVTYTERSGVLDTAAKNPEPSPANNSEKCALYVRNGSKKFDNIKMSLGGNLKDIANYATYLGEPPRIKMKIKTNAPAGTLVEILLGSRKGNNDYPAGTNSQYQAYTSKSGVWEELEFAFSQVPQGSETSFEQVDQVTLLFSPNTLSSDTYYFDDLTGPAVTIKTEEPVVNQEKQEEKQIKKQEATGKEKKQKKISNK